MTVLFSGIAHNNYKTTGEMKARLLKKLRKRIVIEARNREYRAVDRKEKAGGLIERSNWGSLEDALFERRWMILPEARKYKKAKRVLTP